MFWQMFQRRTARPKKMSHYRRTVRLQVEQLEERTLLSANASAMIGGVVFLDPNHSGLFQSTSPTLPGDTVTLFGTTNLGASVNTSATTDVTGSFNFQNVLPGTYQVSAGIVPGFLGSNVTVGQSFTVVGGQAYSQNLGVQGGIDPRFISIRQFTTETTPASFPNVPSGSGQTPVNSRPDNAPIVSSAIAAQAVSVNSTPTMIDLAGHFSDPDMTNSQVTLNITNGGVHEALTLTLLDTTAPQTVANFFDYVNSGAYNNALFSRLVSGFVLQGGGAALNSTGNGIVPIPTNTPVPNEFGTSNTLDTVAMALSGSNINSGTNQFFINLADNSANLDAKKFTVFAKITDISSLFALSSLTSTPNKDESKSAAAAANPTVDLTNLPLTNYTGSNFPNDANASNFMVINSITVNKRDEFLTYSATSSNPNLVTASVNNEWLTLNYAHGQTGTASVTVQATDRFGATVSQTFNVTVNPTAPVVTSVAIAPDSATSATTLTATPSSTDAQGLPVTYSYQWMRNSAPISGATSQTLTLPAGLSATDKITVQVTPSDALLSGPAFTSNAIVVATATPVTFVAPTITSVTITPDNTSNVSNLTSTLSSSSPATFQYQWLRNSAGISGANSSTLSMSGLTVNPNDVFSLIVTPTEGPLSGSPAVSNAVTILGVSPIRTV